MNHQLKWFFLMMLCLLSGNCSDGNSNNENDDNTDQDSDDKGDTDTDADVDSDTNTDTGVDTDSIYDWNFDSHSIDKDVDGIDSITAIDIDGDGDLDITASVNRRDLAWWENTEGSGLLWTKHSIDENLSGERSVQAGDMNNDGNMDIIVGANFISGLVSVWENTTGDGFTWTEHVVFEDISEVNFVQVADFNGDDYLDILVIDSRSNEIIWLENTSSDATTWTRHDVDSDYETPELADVGDLNGDGDLDIIVVGTNANNITWWENADGQGTTWTEHLLVEDLEPACEVHIVDLDGDGDQDILGAVTGDNEMVVWWENASGDATTWTEHVVDSYQPDACSANAADMDGDGDIDIIGTSCISTGGDLSWWENIDEKGTIWRQHIVSYGISALTVMDTMQVADLDGDSDQDIMVGSFWGNYMTWWENLK